MAFSENDIRPQSLTAGLAECYANDIARLLERREEFIEVDCPACGNAERRARMTKHGLTFVECTRCQTMYTSPRPTPSVLDYYYANSESYSYWNKYVFPASEKVRKDKIFAPRAERLSTAVAKYNIGTDLLLEVGAGFGTFGEAVKDLNLFDRIVAVEPTPDLAETCRQKGLEVIESPFEHIDHSQYQASAVAAFEVIEHLFSPRDFFEAASKLLVPGGVVFVSCPNGEGFDLEMMQEHASTVDQEHLNYFNPRSLPLLAESCGFEILEVSTPGQLDVELVRNKVLAGEVDLHGNAFLQKILIDKFDTYGQVFQQFLAENTLSGHLTMVARKPI